MRCSHRIASTQGQWPRPQCSTDRSSQRLHHSTACRVVDYKGTEGTEKPGFVGDTFTFTFHLVAPEPCVPRMCHLPVYHLTQLLLLLLLLLLHLQGQHLGGKRLTHRGLPRIG
jgi:hypothetical protein